MSAGFGGGVGRLIRSRWLRVYLILLLLSHMTIALVQPDWWGLNVPGDGGAVRAKVRIAAMSDTGPIPGETAEISYLRWAPKVIDKARMPVVLLHGSPSSGGVDFRFLAPLLTEAGYDVYAPDLLGFGKSDQYVPDYSIIANARSVLAWMDELHMDRAHIVGWSQGGGTALFDASLAPERVASLSLLGSIGVQEAEGSGSYGFEHTKYAIGWGLVVALPEAVPHFGLAGPRHFRNAFIRNFWDSDQRSLDEVMERLQTPTLILHGRHDVLVPPWCAEKSHEMIQPSRLVMMDATHYFPMGKGRRGDAAMHQAAVEMTAFFATHDVAGVPGTRETAEEAGKSTKSEPKIAGLKIQRSTPWWLVILVITLGTLIIEDLTVVAVGVLIADSAIDPFVGLAGCFVGIVIGDLGLWAIGRFLGRRIMRIPLASRFIKPKKIEQFGALLDGHTGKAIFLSRCLPGTRMPTYIAAGMLTKRTGLFLFWEIMAVCVWTPVLLLLSALIGPPLLDVFRKVFHGPVAIVAALVVVFLIIRVLTSEATYEGRHKTKADLRKIWRPEFWPMWVFYLPLVPLLLWLGLRFRGWMTFSCANPGIPGGGGIVGESKAAILEGLARGEGNRAFLPGWKLIPAGAAPAPRVEATLEAIRSDASLGGLPVILKPDAGQRGHAVKLARTEADVAAYFETMPRDVLVQGYHAGPYEAGIMWARKPANGSKLDSVPGEIFSITRKVFPVLEGDGKNTLEHLIWEHPRFQLQAPVFLKRFEGSLERVPMQGERIVLGLSGNHCQGAMFLDGENLATPALSEAINRIANSYRDDQGRRIDFGRFDVRYANEDELRAGRGFAIVELNGTMSESTNIYDPGMFLLRRYSTLFRQWTLLYRLGAARRREGVRPLGLREMIHSIKGFYRGLPGSRVSD